MDKKQTSSLLAQGNQALRLSIPVKAIWFYERALIENPLMEEHISFNIALAQKMVKDNAINVEAVLIEIIIPVHNALDDLKKCLASIKQHIDALNVKIIIINDGSNEQVSQWLQDFSQNDPFIYLIENSKNLGYTKSVNKGLTFSSAPYVVTLNSDTIVTEGWLNGLIRCMRSDSKVGIVGPLSNAAGLQTIPKLYDQDGNIVVNDMPDNLSLTEMAQLIKKISTPTYPPLAIINGFCFMISRDVIDVIGYMDEDNFPIGYGEETDYCIRALDAGFKLLVADDVYVFHAKSKSFGHKRREELSHLGNKKLKIKHGKEKYDSIVDQARKAVALSNVRQRIFQELSKFNDN